MLVLKINTSHKSIAYYNRKSTTSSSSSIHSLVLVPVDQCVRRSWSSILTAFWDADSRDAAFTLYGSDFTLGSSSMSNSISPPPLPFAAGWEGKGQPTRMRKGGAFRPRSRVRSSTARPGRSSPARGRFRRLPCGEDRGRSDGVGVGFRGSDWNCAPNRAGPTQLCSQSGLI